MKKYEFTGETKAFNGATLHRIRALKDFGDVEAGDLGGWVASEDNLSQEGNCWIGDDARVYGNAWVAGDAEIKATKDTFLISMIGSRYGTTTFFRCADGKVRVACGCFYGDLDEFLAKVEKTHGDNKHGKVYKKLIELAKIQMEEE